MTDNDVLEYCKQNIHVKWINRDINIINYLINRFNDLTVIDIYDKCKEALDRLKHNITNVPLCENCGKPVKYLVNHKFYSSACCNECKKILSNKRLKETSLKKYGTNRPSQANIVKIHQAETNIKKYNSKSVLQNDDVKIKTKETLLKKYNVDNIAKSDYWKNNIKKTSLIKYNTLYPNQSEQVKEKMKQTCMIHYGVDNYFKTKIAREHASSKEAKIKSYNTKKEHNSFNKSSKEEQSYILLKEKFSDVIRQYTSTLYPFACDFYIPSLDLYIECNYHWTHGNKPYEGSKEDLELLNQWRESSTEFYNNAITTWTIRDVNKRNIAKQNNLNYLEFFNINDLINWINENNNK